jgi:hypothetical protein
MELLMSTSSAEPISEIARLIGGTRYHFRDGLCTDLPLAMPGIYAIWQDGELLYIGIAGRAWKSDPNPTKMKGVKDRLDSHHKGKRSGSTLALAIWDRFITPSLSSEEIIELRHGTLQPDRMTKAYIQEHLSYTFITISSYSEARRIEDRIRLGETSAGTPTLNPQKRSKISLVDLGKRD